MTGIVLKKAPQRRATVPATSLREIMDASDIETRCWWGLFCGLGRCPNPATHYKPVSKEQEGHQNGLLRDAKWCARHRHSSDKPIQDAATENRT